MFFSIIVPAYNIDKYLRACLNSIKNQTFRDFEAIIIDDGSTDSSGTICDEFASNDSRFVVKHKTNGGVVSARKEGAVSVRGDYVVTVDGDDYIDENLLENIYKEIISCNPDYVAYGYKEIDETGNVIRERVNNIEVGLYIDEKLNILKESFMYDKRKSGINEGDLIFSLWTKAIKSKIYVESQLKVDNRVEIGDDLVVNIYALNMAKSVLVSEIKGYFYRQHPGSLMHTFKMEDVWKQAVLRDEIIKASIAIQNSVSNQALVCIFYTSYDRLIRLVKGNTNYYDFKMIISEVNECGLFDSLREAKFTALSYKQKMKIYLIRHKMWKVLYCYLYIKANID